MVIICLLYTSIDANPISHTYDVKVGITNPQDVYKRQALVQSGMADVPQKLGETSYYDHILGVIPNNIIKPFAEGNDVVEHQSHCCSCYRREQGVGCLLYTSPYRFSACFPS